MRKRLDLFRMAKLSLLMNAFVTLIPLSLIHRLPINKYNFCHFFADFNQHKKSLQMPKGGNQMTRIWLHFWVVPRERDFLLHSTDSLQTKLDSFRFDTRAILVKGCALPLVLVAMVWHHFWKLKSLNGTSASFLSVYTMLQLLRFLHTHKKSQRHKVWGSNSAEHKLILLWRSAKSWRQHWLHNPPLPFWRLL